ncbi:LytTR family DNA-binding domain-containing protein [Erythrobacter sp. JK5]|uniref:LytTR family DNA-binding domain-containing protein n=1 Tax=Erythrobacter sp. JK5 TaxID=2829500 RepID=UPI001BAE2E2C|nr:LytTR family DNA-binding domain-containing protein [Erythrobacter sp. JK5]QUL37582.1 LytTR family transcriptional regulator DNA-binding domain-containing protein [Erythrobacter sp. JK5]
MSANSGSRREFLLAEIGIVALIGCVIALANLFNPAGMELGARMAYWIGGLLAAWLLFGLVGQVGKAVARLVGIASVWGYVLAIPLATVIIAWAVLWWLGGPQAMFGPGFAHIWPQTLGIAAAMFAVFFILYARSDARSVEDEPADETETVGVADTELHGRLPSGFPPVLALSVEDHYVHVHSRDRREMVLMPLAEAVAAMPQGTGEQVHRSWWVARSAVSQNSREGRDLRLILVNGESVPVSRKAVADLRAKGWLD